MCRIVEMTSSHFAGGEEDLPEDIFRFPNAENPVHHCKIIAKGTTR